MPPVTKEDEKQTQIDRGDYVEDDDYEELEEDKEEESEDDEEDTESTEEDEGEDESKEEKDSEEDDEEGDSEDDEEEDEGDEGSESDQRVPISRLNRVIAQREREKERTEWLEDQLERLLEVQLAEKTTTVKEKSPVPKYDFEEAETKYADLLIEGETAKAAKLRNEISQKRDENLSSTLQALKQELAEAVTETTTTTVDEDRFNTLVENFENKHPFLDIESDDYNEEAVETVNTLMAGFMATGNMSKSQAIKKAVNKVSPMYEKPAATKKESTKRTKDGRKRNVNAMKQTPAKMTGKKKGNRDVSDFNVETMSDKDFSKLTAREKAELRGDIVG